MMHISLNPHPDDKLSDVDFTRLAHEYMEKMGFGEMPYLIVKHEDIDRHHVHIVALRVGTDGRCISDKNNFYRSKEITRELEKKYGLKPAEREKITPDMPIRKVDPDGDIKRQVANTVKMVGMRYKFQTLGEFNAILSLYNIRCEAADGRVNGREYHGLVYHATDDDGKTISTPLKASRLGKFASRTAIEARFERAKDKIDIRPTKRMVSDVMSRSSGKNDFITELHEQNIDLILRYTDEGRIYGATFIDHNTMTVLNGSRLGKAFSANALENRFNNTEERPLAPVNEQEQPDRETHQDSDDGQATTQSHEPAPNQNRPSTTNRDISDDYDLTIPGLDLFQQGQSFNPDEEEFIRRMKKKKKRGQRPKH